MRASFDGGAIIDPTLTPPNCWMTYIAILKNNTARIGRTHDWRRRWRDHERMYKCPVVQFGLTVGDEEAQLHARFEEHRIWEDKSRELFHATNEMRTWCECNALVVVRRPWPIVELEWAEWDELATHAEAARWHFERAIAHLTVVKDHAHGEAKKTAAALLEYEALNEGVRQLISECLEERDRFSADFFWMAPWEAVEIEKGRIDRWLLWAFSWLPWLHGWPKPDERLSTWEPKYGKERWAWRP